MGHTGESEELRDSECVRQVRREKGSEVGKAQQEQRVASDVYTVGIDNVTKTASWSDMAGQAQSSNFYSVTTRGQGRRDKSEARNKAWEGV